MTGSRERLFLCEARMRAIDRNLHIPHTNMKNMNKRVENP
jgi:hypothetical protein